MASLPPLGLMSSEVTPASEAPAPATDCRKLLLDAELAYDRGDYAGARLRAQEIVAAGAPDEILRPAGELLDRLRPDRAALVLTGLCLALFALVAGRYVL